MAKRELPAVPGPIRLTPEDKEFLEGLDAYIAYLDKEIKKAEDCGLDVADMKADLDKHKKLREGLLRYYG